MTTAGQEPFAKESFAIDLKESQVTIGAGHAAKNLIVIAVTRNGEKATVRVTLSVTSGNTTGALLLTPTKVRAVYEIAGGKPKTLTAGDDALRWQTDMLGDDLSKGDVLKISLTDFESNTPVGKASIAVVVQIEQGGRWTKCEKVLEVDKAVAPTQGAGIPRIHYFRADPAFIVHAGQTKVSANFYATGFKTLTLYRNNKQVDTWPSNRNPKGQDGSITGTYDDTPSITTVYGLEGEPVDAAKTTETTETTERVRYQSVQVISPGWNQIALPQGYPTCLFVSQGVRGSGTVRPKLYGIFVDGKRHALYSSETGLDDWHLEHGDVPEHMATSPGVVYENKLWLIGGSCVDDDRYGSEVWCYESDATRADERRWTHRDDFDFPSEMGPRMGHAVVVFPRKALDPAGNERIDKELWVLGGYSNGTRYNDVWRFLAGEWKPIGKGEPDAKKRWSPRLMHAAACFQPTASRRGEAPPPVEVYVYGGAGKPAPEKGLQDLWLTLEGEHWTQLVARAERGIVPPLGPALAAALVMTGGALASDPEGPATTPRLFLGGTFLDANDGNRATSHLLEMKPLNNIWQQSPVIDGWEQFEGGFFYMQAVAFNGLVFVWSLLKEMQTFRPPKLNVLIPR